jgi:hypothetical protein
MEAEQKVGRMVANGAPEILSPENDKISIVKTLTMEEAVAIEMETVQKNISLASVKTGSQGKKGNEKTEAPKKAEKPQAPPPSSPNTEEFKRWF